MEAPSLRYILTRAVFLVTLLVGLLFASGWFKKKQRKDRIVSELGLITSDSNFFRQFSEADAGRSLARAIGLIAEATTLGMGPDQAIDRGLGIKPRFFENEFDEEPPPARERIIRNALRSNYDNFLKLGYRPDFQTVSALKRGELPPISSGPFVGRKPEMRTLIPQEISPGMGQVLANLELCPPQSEPTPQPPTDIQRAAAKQLARDLAEAMIIEEPVRERILQALSELDRSLK